MLQMLQSLFEFPKSQRRHEQDLAESRRNTVMHYARGNVRLQQGRYMTQSDADDLKRRVSRHHF
jgi:hypothetical protein